MPEPTDMPYHAALVLGPLVLGSGLVRRLATPRARVMPVRVAPFARTLPRRLRGWVPCPRCWFVYLVGG